MKHYTSGYVYVTGGYTAGASPVQNLEVWDTSTTPWTQVQATGDIGTPAGIAIGNPSFNPLLLVKDDEVEHNEAWIGLEYTYTISCTNEGNPTIDAENVTITDQLAPETDFVSVTGGGVYNPTTHSVFWDIGTIPAGQPGPTFLLVVKVNDTAVPGTTIYNHCVIESDLAPPTWVLDDETPNDPEDYPGTDIVEAPIAAITYEGDTLLSTEGNPSVDACLAAALRDADGNVLDLTCETITFTLNAEGVGEIVVTAHSISGVAEATQALEPGIYEIVVTVQGDDATTTAILVVYNPEGGFATGGGWIVPEADGDNTYPEHRANFGFNVKYVKKQSTYNPLGRLEFRYSDGFLDLKSLWIQHLVIAGNKLIQFKGWARIREPGGWYQDGFWFTVKAIDNGEPGAGTDTFEIKIWLFDQGPLEDPWHRAAGVLEGGNIVVHKPKGKK